MHESGNIDALAKLSDSTFFVQLKTASGEAVDVQLREMPFTTLTFVLSRIVAKLSESAMGSLADLSLSIARIVELGQQNDTRALELRMVNMLGGMLPLLTTTIAQMPELLERVLLDCIVDATPTVVSQISVTHGVTMLSAVCQRINPEDIAEKLTPVFTLASSAMKRAQKETTTSTMLVGRTSKPKRASK